MKKLIVCLSLVLVAVLTFVFMPSNTKASASSVINEEIEVYNDLDFDENLFVNRSFNSYGFYLIYSYFICTDDYELSLDIHLHFEKINSADNTESYYLQNVNFYTYVFDYSSGFEYENNYLKSFYDISTTFENIDDLTFDFGFEVDTDYIVWDFEIYINSNLYYTEELCYYFDEITSIFVVVDDYSKNFTFDDCVLALIDAKYTHYYYNSIYFNEKYITYYNNFRFKVDTSILSAFEDYTCDDFVDLPYKTKELIINDIENNLYDALTSYSYNVNQDAYNDGYNSGFDNGFDSASDKFLSGKNYYFNLESIDNIYVRMYLSQSPSVSAMGTLYTQNIYFSDIDDISCLNELGFTSDINSIDCTGFYQRLDSYINGDITLQELYLLPEDKYEGYYFQYGNSKAGSFDFEVCIEFKDDVYLGADFYYDLHGIRNKSFDVRLRNYAKVDAAFYGEDTYRYLFNRYGDISNGDWLSDSDNNIKSISIISNQYDLKNGDVPFYTLLTSSLASSNYSTGLQDGYKTGYSDGLEDGYSDGFNSANSGYDKGYDKGYSDGYFDGASVEDFSMTNLFWTIGGIPFESFKQIWNVEFLGINLASFFTGLFLSCAALFIIKKVFFR